MSDFAARMDAIKPSPIVAVSNEVQKLKANGEKVISFSIGVPGFLPPEHVYQAAQEAAEKEHDTGGYLPGRGLPELVSAFVERLKDDGFEGYDGANVCVQIGGKGALFNLFEALVGEGDEVLFPAPYWSTYEDLAKLVGATPQWVRCGADQHYKLTASQLEQAITPRTKLFIFNNPSNPTGMVYSAQEVEALADVLLQHPDIWIISDDIYDKLIYDGETFHHLLHFAPELKSRMALVQSVSKSYGMPGWRVGMVAAPEPLINQLLKLTSQTMTNLPAVAQMAAAAAFSGPHSFLEVVKLDFVRKRDKVLTALRSLEDIQCPKPSGAFYVFPDISRCFGKAGITDDVTFCQRLLQEKKVGCVPGSAFGEPNAIRISYATDDETLDEGLRRFCAFVTELNTY